MHEFSLVEDLLRITLDEAKKANLVKITKVKVRIGDISGVNVDAIEFAFGFLREEDEITREARLIVERVPGLGVCSSCEKEIELERYYLHCPHCNTPTLKITQGSEFLLYSLEGDDESEDEVIEKQETA